MINIGYTGAILLIITLQVCMIWGASWYESRLRTHIDTKIDNMEYPEQNE